MKMSEWAETLEASFKNTFNLLETFLPKIFGAIALILVGIVVVDYYDSALPELTLPLDSAKDAQGNLKEYFQKYQKYLGAQREILPRIENAKCDLQHLQDKLHSIEKKPLEVPPKKSEALPLKRVRSVQSAKPKSRTQRALPYRQFISADGIPILVGKTALHNEELTFRIAKSHHLWLHARGAPGSHVIIQMEKNVSSPPETLKDAATLALFYSNLRKSGKGEVIHTYKKNVRKAKNQKSGSVTVTQERSLWIKVESSRLERLKETNK